MPTPLRIATFNLENLDDRPDSAPSLKERIHVLRPQLLRLDADVLCLQEVNGQETPGQPRALLALQELFRSTPYEHFNVASTLTQGGGEVYDQRNLVIASRYPILDPVQLRHDKIAKPAYRRLTALPAELDAQPIGWERPIFHAKVQIPGQPLLHVINLHLKSRLPTPIEGQRLDTYRWRSVAGWAEGSFLSSLKRVGQALETRVLIDEIFDADLDARVVVAGDFNADLDDVPVEAIRGDVENTGNPALAPRVLLSCEQTVPETSRYSLFHHGRREMLDHLLISRSLLASYRGTEIHNETLHDESIAFATDIKFPESDHAPVVARFELAADAAGQGAASARSGSATR